MKNAAKFLISKVVRRILNWIFVKYRLIKIRKELQKVDNYKDFEYLGLMYDKLIGKEEWKSKKESQLYDFERIE